MQISTSTATRQEDSRVSAIIAAVERAGEELVGMQRQGLNSQAKEDESQFTNADIEAQRIIVETLLSLDLETPLLLEEQQQRHVWCPTGSEHRVLDHNEPLPATYWSVDPADGTAFLSNRSDQFCVSVALVEDGRPTIAVACQPRIPNDVEGLFAYPSDTMPDISQFSKSLPDSLIGLDYCKSTGKKDKKPRKFIERVIKPLVENCRFPENLPSVASGLHLLRGITGLWVTNNAKNWDVAATTLLVQQAGGVTYSLTRVKKGVSYRWELKDVPWDVRVMPPLLFAANDKIAKEALSVINRSAK